MNDDNEIHTIGKVIKIPSEKNNELSEAEEKKICTILKAEISEQKENHKYTKMLADFNRLEQKMDDLSSLMLKILQSDFTTQPNEKGTFARMPFVLAPSRSPSLDSFSSVSSLSDTKTPSATASAPPRSPSLERKFLRNINRNTSRSASMPTVAYKSMDDERKEPSLSASQEKASKNTNFVEVEPLKSSTIKHYSEGNSATAFRSNSFENVNNEDPFEDVQFLVTKMENFLYQLDEKIQSLTFKSPIKITWVKGDNIKGDYIYSIITNSYNSVEAYSPSKPRHKHHGNKRLVHHVRKLKF